MIKVSVVIPVYNVEKYLWECLDSVLQQTLKELEILCINDASTDESLAILQEYEAHDSRIRVITQPKNKGQSAVRSIGLWESNGECIYFLDADSMLLDCEALTRLYRKAMHEEVNGIFFDSKYVYELNTPFSESSSFMQTSEAFPCGIYTGIGFL